ncbi:uncharacterized protein LOC106012568 [Aplysia californica]|uniref:Uncharacterized protein LOC106012568 n=1 Tax=Aplysia californica TaxID=6500 RepID=A0ABM1VXR7_APLCA|nr:uncharacterized protein LOC106012568 [Aplysia californica]
MTLIFQLESCENRPVMDAAIKSVILSFFTSLAAQWPSICHTDCENVHSNVIQDCYSTRSKRNSQPYSYYAMPPKLLQVDTVVMDIPEEINDTTTVRLSNKVIEESLLTEDVFQQLSKYGITFQTLKTLETVILCDPGLVAMENICTQCPAGHFHNTTSKACEKCPIGQYQPKKGQVGCEICQGAATTRYRGAESMEECVSPCNANPDMCHNGGRCLWTEADSVHVYCSCLPGYVGDRCQLRREHYTDIGTVIGASIGAVVSFLLLVLIAVACIACIRYNEFKRQAVRKRARESSRFAYPYLQVPWMGMTSASPRGVRLVDYVDYFTWHQEAQGRHVAPPVYQPRKPARKTSPSNSSRPFFSQDSKQIFKYRTPLSSHIPQVTTISSNMAATGSGDLSSDSGKSGTELIY